ncbi:2-haloacid dehalogenase [Amycolatopsis marina]|uniref:2-haloacid dehalogenase n=2 Tax=Amycolatopsis marina TaxID=490629 RepID=A0A1I0Z899_9PSEU|nr:2-haloacid dehalogenase [Amycolatopsis marina]
MLRRMDERAPARRPEVVLFDVFETLIRLEPLRERLAEVGRPGHELELFFARTLRDGMAYTLAGNAPPFRDVAAAQLAITSGYTLAPEQIEHVLAGFAELPAQPDAAPAVTLLSRAGVPCFAFTHGSATNAAKALERAGLRASFAGVLSAEEIHSFKPPPAVYHWACAQAGSRPDRTALVAVHSWDTNGAARAGLLTGLATRLEGGVPPTGERPHVTGERVDEVVAGLLALPG